MLYNEYVVGYVHVWNTAARRERISRDLIEYVQQFAKVLCYSLVTNGYFKVENSTERRYEAPIIDMSASGLLFAHTVGGPGQGAPGAHGPRAHRAARPRARSPSAGGSCGSSGTRKTRTSACSSSRSSRTDFQFLFQYLYGKTFDPSLEGRWEGGAPPPPLDMR